MSRKKRSGTGSGRRRYGPIFAALGDETRLSLIAKLSGGRRRSISQLAEGSRLTRQAITKHIRVLQGAGLVHSVRSGRKSLCEFDPGPMREIRDYLDSV